MVDFSGKHLGLRPKGRESRVPMLLSLVSDADALPPPPETSNWYEAVAEWPMDNNDTEPDCTAAAAAHAIQQWTTYGEGTSLIMQAAAVMAVYLATKAPDEDGAILVDVLKYWMVKGVQTGFGLHKIAAFAKIDPRNLGHTKRAVAWFGNAIVGMLLPMSAQSQDVWCVVSGAASGAGSWGGHAVIVVGYDQQYLYFVSWGRVMRMTHEFYDTYCDEAYVAFRVQLARPEKGHG
jgi:hypothetical protein